MPSSFIYSGKSASKLSIAYTIKVKMEDCQTNKPVLLPSLVGKRRLIVSQQATEHMTNIQLDSSQVIKQLGLIEQGRAEAHVTFDKSFYKQGDIAVMKAVIDNSKCDKALTEILVQLIRSIDYLSLPGKTTNIKDVVAEQRFEGVPANQIQEKNLQLVLTESMDTDK